MEVKLLVTYTAKPGCREQFVRKIVTDGILTAIRNEEGCLAYDYYFSAISMAWRLVSTVMPGLTIRPTPFSGKEASSASRSSSNQSSS